MEMGDLSRGKAQVAEDDVLHLWVEEGVPVRPDLTRLLVDEVQQDRQIVHAEGPERVLVRPDRAEVLPVAVDTEDVSEIAGVDDLLQPLHAGVIEQKVARHEDTPALLDHLAEARGHPRAGVALRKVGAAFAVEIAEPRKVREIVEVADEVLAPLAEAYLGHACGSSHHHSFHTFPLPVPFLPVAFRRSTTICARSTRSP